MQVHNTLKPNIVPLIPVDGGSIPISPDSPTVPFIWLGTESELEQINPKDDNTIYFTKN